MDQENENRHHNNAPAAHFEFFSVTRQIELTIRFRGTQFQVDILKSNRRLGELRFLRESCTDRIMVAIDASKAKVIAENEVDEDRDVDLHMAKSKVRDR
eukprot:2552145-Rhodomonas_salina.1